MNRAYSALDTGCEHSGCKLLEDGRIVYAVAISEEALAVALGEIPAPPGYWTGESQ